MKIVIILLKYIVMCYGMRGNLPRAPCRPGYIECDPSDSYTYCFPTHKLCDGILDCGGGEDELGCIRSPILPGLTTELPRSGRGGTSVVDTTENLIRSRDTALFAARVYSKLNKLDLLTYLEAERLINQVLYEGQTSTLSNLTTLTSKCSCK